MSNSVLSLVEIEDFFQDLTTRMLGYDSDLSVNQDKVRIGYLQDGAAGVELSDNIAFIRVFTADDAITKQRDRSLRAENSLLATQIIKYYRVHEIFWSFYGFAGLENADLIKSILLDSSSAFQSEISAKKLGIITDIPAPIRLPELFQGQWRQRTDLRIRFNEECRRESELPFIQGVNVVIKTDNGITENVEISNDST